MNAPTTPTPIMASRLAVKLPFNITLKRSEILSYFSVTGVDQLSNAQTIAIMPRILATTVAITPIMKPFLARSPRSSLGSFSNANQKAVSTATTVAKAQPQ